MILKVWNGTAWVIPEAASPGLALKADIASPSFTGIPLAPTADIAVANTQIATTAHVTNKIASKANLDSPTFTGTPLSTTAAITVENTQIATTAYVAAKVDDYGSITTKSASYTLALTDEDKDALLVKFPVA
jgi:hypothetical protein